jgi:hypothetical protein
VLILVTGAHKSLALMKCVEEGVNHMWTLSCLQLHQHATLIVDEESTLDLKVKTVKVSPRGPCLVFHFKYSRMLSFMLTETPLTVLVLQGN